MEDNIDQYELEKELNEAKIKDANKIDANTPVNVIKDNIESTAEEVVKKSLWKAIAPILPCIGIGIAIFLGGIVLLAVIINIGCGLIPGSSLFSPMCRDVKLSEDEKNNIKNTSGIDRATNDICQQNGGSYNSYGSNCGYGY